MRERGRAADPVIRQKVATLWIGEQVLQLNAYRSLTRILRGVAVGSGGAADTGAAPLAPAATSG